MADPPKVYPNQTLRILVEVEDEYGIESATAEYFHEKGSDIVNMMLIAADENRETYQSIWIVHDTLLDEFYNTKVTLTNRKGQTATTDVEWQDPEVVTHTWSNITGAGYCIFVNSTLCPTGYSLPYDTGSPWTDATTMYLGLNATHPGSRCVYQGQGLPCGVGYYGGGSRHNHYLDGFTDGPIGNGRRHGGGANTLATSVHVHNLTPVTTDYQYHEPLYRTIYICCKD
ncbi:MAG: hypothetical protein KAT43_06585 [Nanoarchaeota archaeon]|nr:hypothetical protein [Nanoarchaeota archaeon]